MTARVARALMARGRIEIRLDGEVLASGVVPRGEQVAEADRVLAALGWRRDGQWHGELAPWWCWVERVEG